LRRRRIRTRLRDGAAALIACAAVSGCAGGGSDDSTPPRPAFAPAVAQELSAAADRVADLLAAGDTCGAAHAADDLQRDVIEAVNAGDVPPAFQEELGAVAAELVNEVNCPPASDDEGEGDEGWDD
jgi:hypothetical protein